MSFVPNLTLTNTQEVLCGLGGDTVKKHIHTKQTVESFETPCKKKKHLKIFFFFFSVPCSLYPPISLADFMLALSRKTLPLHRSVGDLQINKTIGGEGPAGV